MFEKSRIRLLRREEVVPEIATVYDALLAARGVVPNMFKVLAHAPAIAPAVAGFLKPLLADGADGTVTAFGNLGRNIYRGPYQQNWDFSLLKNFKITERQSLRFTTDFFNVWNHANFANPSINDIETAVCDPKTISVAQGCVPANGIGYFDAQHTPFGRIFSTVGTPRLIQFSLRYAF